MGRSQKSQGSDFVRMEDRAFVLALKQFRTAMPELHVKIVREIGSGICCQLFGTESRGVSGVVFEGEYDGTPWYLLHFSSNNKAPANSYKIWKSATTLLKKRILFCKVIQF